MNVLVKTTSGFMSLNSTPLSAARLVGEAFGYVDIDVEPGAPGSCKLQAKHRTAAVGVNVSGSSVEDVCEKFIALMGGYKGE